MMEKVMDRADEVLLEGRQSVRNLRQISCSQLSDALANCGKELAQDHPALFDLTVSGPHNVLDPVLSNELYLLAREAIFNSFRHSQARTIEVEVIYESARLSLRVRDDGVGMSQQTVIEGKAGHWGLPGMRERAEKIGGQIKIWSAPNSGTEIEVTIPAQIAYRNYARRNFGDRLKEFSLTLGGKTP
jgi:signal transduction histidine kinase